MKPENRYSMDETGIVEGIGHNDQKPRVAFPNDNTQMYIAKSLPS